jgi:hypothetical protein
MAKKAKKAKKRRMACLDSKQLACSNQTLLKLLQLQDFARHSRSRVDAMIQGTMPPETAAATTGHNCCISSMTALHKPLGHALVEEQPKNASSC